MQSDPTSPVGGTEGDAVESAVPIQEIVEALEGTLTVVDHHVRMRRASWGVVPPS